MSLYNPLTLLGRFRPPPMPPSEAEMSRAVAVGQRLAEGLDTMFNRSSNLGIGAIFSHAEHHLNRGNRYCRIFIVLDDPGSGASLEAIESMTRTYLRLNVSEGILSDNMIVTVQHQRRRSDV